MNDLFTPSTFFFVFGVAKNVGSTSLPHGQIN